MKKPLIIPLPTHFYNRRGNDAVWNACDWNNPDAAIARALNVDHKSVAYQRWKRGLPKKKKGGWHPRGWKQKYKSEAPLPQITRQL